MPQLITPTAELFDPWRQAHLEWGPGTHEDGFGLRAEDDTSTLEGFSRWLARVSDEQGRSWWILDGDTVAGGIGLRTDDDPVAFRHGHIGYGVRPSCRGRGLATWALRQVLLVAAGQGRRRVRLVCRRDNAASVEVILRVGGRLEEGVRHPVVDRYLVDLAKPPDR